MLKYHVNFVRQLFSGLWNLFIAVIVLIKDLLGYLILALMLLIVGGIIGIFGVLWYSHYREIVPAVEQTFRCNIAPSFQDRLSGFLEPILLRFYGEGVIYWNGIAGIQRAFSNRVLTQPLLGCTLGQFGNDTVKTVLAESIETIIFDAAMFFDWLFTGITTSIYPVYIVIDGVLNVLSSILNVLKCACQYGDPFWVFLQKTLGSRQLRCTVHQFGAFVQKIIQAAYHSIGISAINLIDYTLGNSPTFLDPNFSIEVGRSVEVYNDALYYGFAFLDDTIHNIGCVADNFQYYNSTNETLFDTNFDTCKQTGLHRVRVFSVLSPLVISIVEFLTSGIPNSDYVPIIKSSRTMEVAFDFLWNSTNSVIEGDFNFPGAYATTSWRVDMVWDTLRTPANRPSSLLNSTFLDAFYLPNASLPVCTVVYNSSFQSCQECNIGPFLTLEEALCNLGNDIDGVMNDIFVPYIGPIFSDIFCCLFAKAVRIFAEGLQFASDRVKNLFILGLEDFVRVDLTQQSIFDQFVNEIAGPAKITILPLSQNGTIDTDLGILSCITRILVRIDPRLRCVGDFIVLLLKPLAETFRLLLYFIPGFINQVIFWSDGTVSTPERITLLDLVCTNGNYCIDTEAYVFKYLRQSRILNGTSNTNIFLNFTMLDPNASPGAIECFCNLLSSDFINSFLPPSEQIFFPDICCGIKYAVRLIIDIVKFFVGFTFATLQTVIDLVNSPGQIDDIAVLDFLSCFSDYNATDGSSSQCVIPEIISDAQDFLACPCLVILYIDDQLQGQSNLDCLCDFISSLTTSIILGFTAVVNLAQTMLQILNCISTNKLNNPSFPECGTILEDKFLYGFAIAETAINGVSSAAGSLGCLVGTIFFFDCIDGSTDGLFLPCENPTCRPSDTLAALFQKITEAVAALFIILLNVIKSIFLAVFNQVNTLYPTFSDFLMDVLVQIGVPLFGDPLFPFNTLEGRGLVQYIGIFLNCIIGPDSTCNITGTCFGRIFIIFGDKLREVYNIFVSIVTNIIKLFELFFGGGSSTDILNAFTAIFQGIFNLIAAVLTSIPQILDFFKNLLVAFIRVFLGDVLATIIDTILTVLINVLGAIINGIIAILQFFGIISKKRSTFEFYRINLSHQYNTANIIQNIKNNPLAEETIELLEGIDESSFCGRLYREIKLINQDGHFPRDDDMTDHQYEIPLEKELLVTGCFFTTLLPIRLRYYMSTEELFKNRDTVDNVMAYNNNAKKRNVHGPSETSSSSANGIPNISNNVLNTMNSSAQFFLDILKGLSSYSEWKSGKGYIMTNLNKEELTNSARQYQYNNEYIASFIKEQPTEVEDGSTKFVPYMKIMSPSNGSEIASSVVQFYEQNAFYQDSLGVINMGLDFMILAQRYNMTEESAIQKRYEKRSLMNPGINIQKLFDIKNSIAKMPTRPKVTLLLFENIKERFNVAYNAISQSFTERWENTRIAEGGKKKIELFLRILPFGSTIDEKLGITKGLAKIPEVNSYNHYYNNNQKISSKFTPEWLNINIEKRGLQQPTNSCEICSCEIYDGIADDITEQINYVIARRNATPTYFTGGQLFDYTVYTGPSISAIYDNFGQRFILTPTGDKLSFLADALINTTYSLVGIDLESTVVNFLTNQNLNISEGPGGLAFFLKYDTHIPFYSRCDRYLNLQCNFGYGIGKSLLYNILIFLVIFVIIMTVIPPLGHFMIFFLAILGITMAMLFMWSVGVFAWNYNPTCLAQPSSIILSFVSRLFPFDLPILPLIPECVGEDIYNLLTSVISDCPIPWPEGILLNGTSSCPPCPQKIQLPNCNAILNIGGANEFFGYIAYNFLGPVYDVLNFFVPFIFSNYNPTAAPSIPSTAAERFYCYIELSPGLILPFVVFLASLLLILPIIRFILSVIGILWNIIFAIPIFPIIFDEIDKVSTQIMEWP